MKPSVKKIKNKFAILSHILPPSDSGQAVMLSRLLKDTYKNDYILISDKNYNIDNDFAQSSKKLKAKYYCLNQNNDLKLWEKGLLAFPLVRNLYTFWRLLRYKGKQIEKIINKEKIRTLVVCTGDITDIPAGYFATKNNTTRLIIYSFDDYVYQWIGFQRYLAKILAFWIFRRADGLIVPNEFLKKDYYLRYKMQSSIVRNPFIEFSSSNKKKYFSNIDINIVYTGSIYHAHQDAFLNLIKATKLIKRSIKIHLFTGQSKDNLAKIGINDESLVIHKNINQKEIINIQRQADILFLPLAFNSLINEVIRTSAPGKIGEYLASYTPILVHAPKNSYLAWYFKEKNCGFIVDALDPQKLSAEINRIITKKKLVEKIINNAIQASADFSIEKSIKAFNNVIDNNNRILLLTPAPPNSQSSGSLMLANLCKMITHDQIYCFVAKDPIRKVIGDDYPSIVKYQIMNRPIETTINQKYFYYIEKLKDIYIQKIMVKKAIDFGKRNKVNCVWVVLQGKTMISMANPVSEALNVSLITQVWDEPEWILSNTNIDQKTKSEILKKFDLNIRKSIICATASQVMAKNYQQKYKVKTTVFMGSLDEKMLLPPAKKINVSGNFKIGFAGQLYAKNEWRALIKALEKANWKIFNRNVKIYLLGKFQATKSNKHIITLGYKSQKESINILSKMDLLYLPYWFDKEHRKIAETSFPSKLTSYLAAGRPIFFHGPEYSSPAKFIFKNQCGILCHSLEEKNIIDSIYLLNDPKKYSSITKKGNIAFKNFLTSVNLNIELNKFLNSI